MLKKLLPTVRNAIILLKMDGPKVFLAKLWRQVYCNDTQIGLEINLETFNTPSVECKMRYYVRTASEADMNEAFHHAKTEGRDSIETLLFMKWLYECGFRNWYIARTVDTNEIGFLVSLICYEDNGLIEKNFKSWFPMIRENEAIMEGGYTFEKYRGLGLATSAHIDIINKILKGSGLKRMILYIKEGNLASFRHVEKIGYKRFEEIHVKKAFFFTRRNFIRV